MWIFIVAAVALIVLAGTQQAGQAVPAPAPPADVPLPPLSTSTLPGDNHDYDNQILYAAGTVYAEQFRGDPLAPFAVKSIIWKEQGRSWQWDTNATGDNGCSFGLMQINVCANPEFDALTMLDPNQNILAGTSVLARNYQASGDWWTAIKAYNGSGAAASAYANDVLGFLQSLAQQAGLSA